MYIDKNSIDSFIMALYMHFYLFYLFVIWILMCMQISAREIRNTEKLTLKMSILYVTGYKRFEYLIKLSN